MELVINDRIRNRKVQFFNSFDITLKYNAIASDFSFDFYYSPDIIEQKEMACVGHYHICKLYHEGELLLTGYITEEAFLGAPQRRLVPIAGYSLPGVLEDCQVPTNSALDAAIAAGNLKLPKGTTATPYAYPIQDEGLTLRQIAQKYLAPFGIQMIVDDSVAAVMDETFEETTAKPNDTIKQYLTELATQKNINLTHDELGRLVFTRVPTNLKPIFEFDVPKGGIPGVSMGFKFSGQQMHSQITVIKQADVDNENAGEETVTNPYVPFVFRPRTIIQNSGNNTDTALAAKNALADELRNLKWTISMDRWDFNGKIVKPKNLITLRDPEVYLFNKTTLFIESVNLKGDQKEMTAELTCCLPEVYNGNVPKYIYQGINLH
jgi:prophage tail gpP-like protein